MPGIKDRIVNVPIKTSTINENVRSLPRTLDEAQVIPVSLRKQKSMLSSQYKQQIRPAVLRAWFNLLKTIYPYYNTKEIDDGKLEFIIDDLEEELDDTPDAVEVLDNILEEDIQKEVDEIQYIENDPVQKYQTENISKALQIYRTRKTVNKINDAK